MTDYTYNYNSIPSALEQRKALTAEDSRPKARPKGIASKPNGEASPDVEPDYIEKMLDLLLPYFSSKEDADKALSNGTPDREALKLASINEFEDLSQEAYDAIEQAQQTRIGPADRRDVDVTEEVIRPETPTESAPETALTDLQIMEPEGVEDMPPLPKPATDDGGLMSRDTSPEEGETTTEFPARPPLDLKEDGLMSKPLTDDDMGLPDDDNYMGVLDDGSTQDLLDRIALGEGADPKKLKAQDKYGIGSTEYDMVYGYGSALAPDKPVTEMTMKELEAYQRKLITATKGKVKGTSKGTSAVGKYQVIKTSLFGKNGTAANPQKDSWADKLGLTEDTVYTPAIQEKIGFLALKEAGYNSYIRGKRSQDSFQNKIANVWASVAKADGTDKYGQGIHTVKKDLEPMFKSLAPIKTEDTAVSTSLRPKARN